MKFNDTKLSLIDNNYRYYIQILYLIYPPKQKINLMLDNSEQSSSVLLKSE